MTSKAVVISTYNGSRYILDQLQSIVSDSPDIRFYIRDDGSSDCTVSVITSFFSSIPGSLAYFEVGSSNLGPCDSYFKLLSLTVEDYVFLCDQDDVWIPGRCDDLIASMSKLVAEDVDVGPRLVFSDAEVVDSNLNVIDHSFWAFEKNSPVGRLGLARSLLQNRSPGCTMLLNRSLVRLCPLNAPDAIMHDWWIIILAFAYGSVGYLNKPTLKYRQHSGNVIGASSRKFSRANVFKMVKGAKSSLMRTCMQAQSILNVHDDLPPSARVVISEYVEIFRSRLKIVRIIKLMRYKFFKSSIGRNVGLFFFI